MLVYYVPYQNDIKLIKVKDENFLGCELKKDLIMRYNGNKVIIQQLFNRTHLSIKGQENKCLFC